MELLLERGASMELADAAGQTALMIAASKGHVDAVNVLLQAGASIGKKTLRGATALSAAYLGGHHQVARILVENGASTTWRANVAKVAGWLGLST
ncbi:hypothetical protein PF004_g20472 [Phytophthora fragariae]|nr:hypothetical protein PF004_g20472 [Phytophthora fragariae]